MENKKIDVETLEIWVVRTGICPDPYTKAFISEQEARAYATRLLFELLEKEKGRDTFPSGAVSVHYYAKNRALDWLGYYKHKIRRKGGIEYVSK